MHSDMSSSVSQNNTSRHVPLDASPVFSRISAQLPPHPLQLFIGMLRVCRNHYTMRRQCDWWRTLRVYLPCSTLLARAPVVSNANRHVRTCPVIRNAPAAERAIITGLFTAYSPFLS